VSWRDTRFGGNSRGPLIGSRLDRWCSTFRMLFGLACIGIGLDSRACDDVRLQSMTFESAPHP